ncbi:hypothetical protein SEA_ZOOBEAR_72 [Streptomyces phage ZooBear]|uniref:Uncharacterized protein n=2 Tax=Immanueltrevirus immanuel3 TaxID=2846399 RepID=A0A2H5BM15_9CAUD|nr:hypothetical protein SEA_HAUGEANATOR_72 [Streptomyces phage HaugeAnator]AUG87633.1 hypothetical protein SEA_ZOOBEAR_72 [Streptomyces phage ZooBear]
MTYELGFWLMFTLGMAACAAAQFYKVRSEALTKEVLDAHDWVDEIIEALENPSESGPDERLDRLVSERSAVQWSGSDGDQVDGG